MNQKQKEYAMNRVRNLVIDVRDKIVKECTTPATVLTFDERLDLLLAGTVKFKRNARVRGRQDNPYVYLENLCDFSKHEKDAKTDSARIDRRMKEVRAVAQKTKDEIMLGDSKEALHLIKEFEKVCSNA